MGKFLLVVLVFAAAVYAVIWLLERRRLGLPLRPRRTEKPLPRSSAPDDDEDFLRWLERKQRHEDPDASE